MTLQEEDLAENCLMTEVERTDKKTTLAAQDRLIWKEIIFNVQLMPAGIYPLDSN